jgi:hypothetical protein
MKFEELTNNPWTFIKPLLPPQPIVGMKRADDKKNDKNYLSNYDIGSAEGHEYPDLQAGDEVNPRTLFVLA